MPIMNCCCLNFCVLSFCPNDLPDICKACFQCNQYHFHSILDKFDFSYSTDGKESGFRVCQQIHFHGISCIQAEKQQEGYSCCQDYAIEVLSQSHFPNFDQDCKMDSQPNLDFDQGFVQTLDFDVALDFVGPIDLLVVHDFGFPIDQADFVLPIGLAECQSYFQRDQEYLAEYCCFQIDLAGSVGFDLPIGQADLADFAPIDWAVYCCYLPTDQADCFPIGLGLGCFQVVGSTLSPYKI